MYLPNRHATKKEIHRIGLIKAPLLRLSVKVYYILGIDCKKKADNSVA